MLIIKFKSYDVLLRKTTCIFYLLALCYFLKNTLISGCLIYPFSFTCFSDLSWSSKEIATNLLVLTEASTKSYDRYLGSLNISEYIDSFNWFSTWALRNIEEFNNYILTSILAILLLFISSKIKKNKIKFNYLEFTILILFVINVIIFLKSPVSRYHHVMFLLFALSLTIFSKKLFIKKIFFFKSINNFINIFQLY